MRERGGGAERFYRFLLNNFLTRVHYNFLNILSLISDKVKRGGGQFLFHPEKTVAAKEDTMHLESIYKVKGNT